MEAVTVTALGAQGENLLLLLVGKGPNGTQIQSTELVLSCSILSTQICSSHRHHVCNFAGAPPGLSKMLSIKALRSLTFLLSVPHLIIESSY
jgi:hypothetical protein